MNLKTAGLRLLAPMLVILGGAVAMAAAAPAEPSADDVRAAYVEAGLNATTPTVSADGVASFSVDSATASWGQPTLRVFVYPSTSAALSAHHQAQAREEGNRNVTLPYSDDRGPQLLSGYGMSVWRQNVALIQAAPADDIGAYPLEIDCSLDPMASTINPLPRTTVGVTYIAPLEGMLAARAQASQ